MTLNTPGVRAPGLLARMTPLFVLVIACGSADAKEGDPTRPAAPGASAESASAASARPSSGAEADATRVEVAVLQGSEASLESTIPGEIEGSRDAIIASAQGGPIDRVLVEEGDKVKRNQLLVQVDSALYAIRKRQAETDLARARRNLERSQGLGTAMATAERERREAEVAMLETNLDLANLQLSRADIRAPFAGVVAEIHVEVGEVVAGTAPLLHLVKLDPVHVVLSVPDRDVVALTQGSEVDVHVPALPKPLKGKLTRINPTADLETRTFHAEVEVENPDQRVLPGMIASVTLDRTLVSGAVVIPQDWLITRRDGLGVFVDEGGTARYLPVKAGRVVRDQVVIDDGLKPGARLVITGHRGLADGDQLVIAREGHCCTKGRVVFE